MSMWKKFSAATIKDFCALKVPGFVRFTDSTVVSTSNIYETYIHRDEAQFYCLLSDVAAPKFDYVEEPEFKIGDVVYVKNVQFVCGDSDSVVVNVPFVVIDHCFDDGWSFRLNNFLWYKADRLILIQKWRADLANLFDITAGR